VFVSLKLPISEPILSTPSLLKRLLSMLYESLLLIAMLATATLLFIGILGDATAGIRHYLLQAYLWLIAGAYFVWCWIKSGQTLAMQTWHIRLVNQSGQPVSLMHACKRYVLATLFFGPSFVWALFDRESQFLHDRLTGSRLVLEKKVKDSVAG